jgi:hypothetical protein
MLKFGCNRTNIIMETASVDKVLRLFYTLSKSEQLEIAEKIDKETFEERWLLAEAKLPDVDMSDEDIMKEVRAVRYGRGKN